MMRPLTHRLTATCIVAALLLLTPTAALASATRFEILASAAQTATAQGGAINVSGLRELVVFVDCTASSGTTPVLDLYLQSSSDGGTTWFDLPNLYRTGTTIPIDADEVTTVTNGREIADAVVACTGGGYRGIGIYPSGFGDLIRAAWVISGTTPSFTFSVKAVGKN